MKKLLGKIGAIIVAALLAATVVPVIPAHAAGDQEETVSFFISFVGSGLEAGDGGLVYTDPFGNANSEGMIAVNASAKAGDTVVISLELPEMPSHITSVVPVMYTGEDNIVFGNVDADVSLKVNGEDVEITPDPEAAKAWANPIGGLMHSWMLYGGYDENGVSTLPVNAFAGATKIEYTITLNSFTVAHRLGPAYEGESLVYIDFSGDVAGGETHEYHGPGFEGNSDSITAVTSTAIVGDTVTVSLNFPNAITHVHNISPVIVPSAEDTSFAEMDISVALRIDGSDTPIDYLAGSPAWAETVGDNETAWRICGGCNESGTAYVDPSLFAGATKIEYIITVNSVFEEYHEPEPEVIEEMPPETETDPIADVQPVQEQPADIVIEEENTSNGLVIGILVAVAAIAMIVCGILLSRERPLKEEDLKDEMDKTGYGDDDEIDDKAFDKALDDIAEEEKAEAEKEETEKAEAETEDEKSEEAGSSEKTEEVKSAAATVAEDTISEKASEPEDDEIADLSEEMKRIDEVIAKGPFRDDWSSLSKVKVPDWFASEKFGIFVHWGVFTSEEFSNEWYPRGMYIKDSEEWKHHVEKYGAHTATGYKDYVERFKGENFDPTSWMEIFKKSGARYVVPVGEHHDGFQMYKSRMSHWNAAEKGPHRDVIAELEKSAKEYGIHFGVSSHRFEHWWFLGNGRAFDSDIKGEFKRGDLYWPSQPEPKDIQDFDVKPAPSEEFMQDWLARTCEIVDLFNPEVLYFDWWIAQKVLKPYLKKAAAYYYNVMASKGLEGVIVSKVDAFAPGASVRDIERGGLSGSASYIWQSDTPICKGSWGYVPGLSYKSGLDIVRELIDIVSKNGNLLLNVGPKADGTICEEEKKALREIGEWLDKNGEMIYGSTPYKIFGEGKTNREEGGFKDMESLEYTSEDFRFTAKDGCIYAAAMKPAKDGHYVIKSFAKSGEDGGHSYKGLISKVVLLADGSEVKWDHKNNGLEIRVKGKARDDMPVVFKIELL